MCLGLSDNTPERDHGPPRRPGYTRQLEPNIACEAPVETSRWTTILKMGPAESNRLTGALYLIKNGVRRPRISDNEKTRRDFYMYELHSTCAFKRYVGSIFYH